MPTANVRTEASAAMIEAARFIEAARARGFEHYAGVPCSFLTPFINFVLQAPDLDYVSAANEGDAVALSAGVALAGKRAVTMMQNSGLGNAVSPLTSLTWTFRLPQLLIITWRGEPGLSDEPQHALMGPITPAMLETMELAWELFPTEDSQIEAALERATRHMDETGRPYVLLMKKGSVAPYALQGGALPARARGVLSEPWTEASSARPAGSAASIASAASVSQAPTRREALLRMLRYAPLETSVVFASTGFCGRELYALEDRANQFYMVGSMGCVSTLALGFALLRPDLRVIVLDGDGAALMRMSAFATLGTYGPDNLFHLLLDNGVHESTGGQRTVAANVSFAALAAACGYAFSTEGDTLEIIDQLFASPDRDGGEEKGADGRAGGGARFARLALSTGTPDDLPRPTVTPVQVKERLMAHIGPKIAESN